MGLSSQLRSLLTSTGLAPTPGRGSKWRTFAVTSHERNHAVLFAGTILVVCRLAILLLDAGVMNRITCASRVVAMKQTARPAVVTRADVPVTGAISLNNLSVPLGDLGRAENTLTAGEETVTIRLAAARWPPHH